VVDPSHKEELVSSTPNTEQPCQLGSCPNTADLTREEETMVRAMRRASAAEGAPSTFTSIRHVAPCGVEE